MTTLEVRGLCVSVEGSEILTGLDLTVSSGEVHAVMGPNGSGKSTLSHVIMGRPGYEVTSGSITLDGADVLAMTTPERAYNGLFLAMQYPTEVPGVSLQEALGAAFDAQGRDITGIAERLAVEAGRIGLAVDLLDRPLNVDLSGGEKKRNETIQLALLEPKIAVLDELDSGLDIDALRACARRIEAMTNDGLGVLAITHYHRLLDELHPDRVHILVGGRIVASGGPELAAGLEDSGYGAYAEETEIPVDISEVAVADPFADPLA